MDSLDGFDNGINWNNLNRVSNQYNEQDPEFNKILIPLLKAFRGRDHQALRYIFKLRYPHLCTFATTMTRNMLEGEAIAVSVFINLLRIKDDYTKWEDIKATLERGTRHQIRLYNTCGLHDIAFPDAVQDINFNELRTKLEQEVAHITFVSEPQQEILAELNGLFRDINMLPPEQREVIIQLYLQHKVIQPEQIVLRNKAIVSLKRKYAHRLPLLLISFESFKRYFTHRYS